MSVQRAHWRVPVTHEQVLSSLDTLANKLQSRLDKHGPLSYIGSHECYGICAEEMDELLEAIRLNDRKRITEELLDVAVAAIFSVASLNALETTHGYLEVIDPDLGYVFELQDYLDAVKEGLLVDYDGFGHPARGGMMNNRWYIKPSKLEQIPEDATHIVWYNR